MNENKCTAYFIEYTTPNYYEFKDFWYAYSPNLEQEVVKKVKDFAYSLEEILDLNSEFKNFIHTLSPGTYTYKNGMLINWDYGSQQEPIPATTGGF